MLTGTGPGALSSRSAGRPVLGLHVALSASVGGSRDRPPALAPQEQAPARPLYGQVDVGVAGAAPRSATASGCGTCPNPGGGRARCRSSPLLPAPASACTCTG